MASLGDLYNDLKTLCKQWFYDKTEADGRFAPKKLDNANYFVMTDSSKELTTQQNIGNITREGKVGSTQDKLLITGSAGLVDATDTIPSAKIKVGSSGNASKNVVTNSSGQIILEAKPTVPSASSTTPSADVTGGAVGTGTTYARADHQHPLSNAYATSGHNHDGTYAPASHTQATTTISNDQAYNNIKAGESSTLTLTNQKLINDAINTKLGTLLEADLIVVTTNKGTASASTMNKLYLVAKSGGASGDGYDIWITVRTGSSGSYSYAWEKVDDFNLQQNIETTTNKVQDILLNYTSTTKYPSAKAVYEAILLLGGGGDGTGELILEFTASSGNMEFSTASGNETPFVFTENALIIDWGDGTTATTASGRIQHTYTTAGTYEIKIKGGITQFQTNNNTGTFLGVTGLTSITIPPTVTSIGAVCLSGCTGLSSIRFEGYAPPTIGSQAFYKVPTTCKIIVPSSVLNTYMNTTNMPNYTYIGWSDYTIDSLVNGNTSAVTSNAVYDALQNKLNTTLSSTVTNNGSMLVTNSSNTIGTQSIIDVLDGVVNQLITYGSS